MILSPFFYKKNKAPPVSTFFVFGDTSHLFNLYTYYKAWKCQCNPECATFITGTLCYLFLGICVYNRV